MTHLSLRRTQFSDKATIGDLLIDGIFECHTLEDKVREVEGQPVSSWKIHGQTAIPVGSYQVVIDMSARFGRMMPHLLDVPGFNGIRMHKGNTDMDTEGCILLGMLVGGSDLITHSTEAFDAFYPKLVAALEQGEVWITVS